MSGGGWTGEPRDFYDDQIDVRRLDEQGVGLTEWETEFVEQCVRRVNRGRALTDKMRVKLDEITRDRVP